MYPAVEAPTSSSARSTTSSGTRPVPSTAEEAVARRYPWGVSYRSHPRKEVPMSTTSTYTVNGMTCGHCVASVTEEVSKLDGVTAVDVDLSSGRVTVESDGPVDDAAFAAAVDEARSEEHTSELQSLMRISYAVFCLKK